MNAEEVKALARAGESLSVEFKTEVNDDRLVEAVVCLANADGGRILLGVADDGSITGTTPRHGTTTDPVRLASMIAGRTAPSVVVEAEVHAIDGKHVVAVHVAPPRTIVSTSGGLYLRRAIDVQGKPTCVPMLPHEQLGRAGAIGAVDVSLLPLPGATKPDLDPAELARFRDLAGGQGDRVLATLSDHDLITALGFLLPGGVLALGAVLLFGTDAAIERFIPTHETAFQVLGNLDVVVNRIDRRPLLRAMIELTTAIEPYNPEEEIEDGLFRIGLPRFADSTLRELVANALVHRDYAMRGQVRVAIEDGVLAISNAGGFPAGITVGNVLTAPPNARNPRLADAFKRAGIVDRTGRGINKVYWSQLALGRAAPDYGRSTAQWVEVRVRPGPADRELAAFVAGAERRGDRLSLPTLQVLHEVRGEGRITSSRAAELLQLNQDEARALLNELVGRGNLESRGERKARTYHLSAAMYRQLGRPADYVRTRGFDRIQQEEMVVTYAREHGSITRREAATLCQLSDDQASRLLRGLAASGRLEMEGSRRSARYREPAR
ncbi:MAG: RNA-binding domain-containing protein [Actinomycetota bacterium]